MKLVIGGSNSSGRSQHDTSHDFADVVMVPLSCRTVLRPMASTRNDMLSAWRVGQMDTVLALTGLLSTGQSSDRQITRDRSQSVVFSTIDSHSSFSETSVCVVSLKN